jgi:hypothetical protein
MTRDQVAYAFSLAEEWAERFQSEDQPKASVPRRLKYRVGYRYRSTTVVKMETDDVAEAERMERALILKNLDAFIHENAPGRVGY